MKNDIKLIYIWIEFTNSLSNAQFPKKKIMIIHLTVYEFV